ncbi:MKRN2 opposite strand, tandem duplicate 1 [Hoplias malabaricus]|uniref:MKRN2 opposite strand, tandem duplicate 1 n=1 Tax=Hoplias malabaricus TaxID=27720 RepID=UPI00346328C0
MDRTVVKFSHCGRDIFNFSDQTTKLSSFCQQKQTGARRNTCPVCNESLAFGLLDAPVSLPYPFTNGHTAPCSFLLGANDGPQFLGEWNDTELHVGVSNSNGLVYNYTLSGMQMDQCGWEQCVCIQLVPPWRDSLIASWDKELQLFSALSEWTPERFHEEREFGSCCYGFALTFINHMRALDNKVSLSRNEFTTSQVLPRMKRASMYIKVYEEILQSGFYTIEKNEISSI